MARSRRRKAHNQGCTYQRGPRNWWIKWRERGQVRYSGGYETRDLAEQVRAKIVAEIAAGRVGLPVRAPVIPLDSLAEDWLNRRQFTHRNIRTDRSRWRKHLKPVFGALPPSAVDAAALRKFVEAKLAAGLNASTVGHCVRLFSSLFTDLVERKLAPENPVRTLPRSTRRLFRPTTDPRETPFLESLNDIQRVFAALPEPINVAFALGALSGLWPAELLGLSWRDIDMDARRIHVRRQVQNSRLAPLKDDESRVVPIQKAVMPILSSWKLRSGGDGLLFKPTCLKRGGGPDRPPAFMRQHTLRRHLATALAACKLPALSWYQSTRHSFASWWVLSGGSLEKLAKVMGHSSITTTQRYSHLKPDLFRNEDYQLLDVDLLRPSAEVVAIGQKEAENGTVGYAVVTQAAAESSSSGVSR